MKEQELLAAIGGAEDRFLEELEQPKVRRLPRQFGLAAALIALLLTACAAPAVLRSFDKLQSGQVVASEYDKVWEFWTVRDKDGQIVKQDTRMLHASGDLELQIKVESDAPQSIETHYLPLRLMELYDVTEYSDEEALFRVEFTGSAPKDRTLLGIEYRQYALPEDGKLLVEDIFNLGPMEAEWKTYGDISVLEYKGYCESVDSVYYSVNGNCNLKYHNTNARYLFWSEGMYLYCLKLPRVYPLVNESDFETVVASLTAVEDISEYLPAAE